MLQGRGCKRGAQQGCGLGLQHGLHSFSNEVWPAYAFLHVGGVQPDPRGATPAGGGWRLPGGSSPSSAAGLVHVGVLASRVGVPAPIREAPVSSSLWALRATVLGAGNPKLKLLGESWESRAQEQTIELHRPLLPDLCAHALGGAGGELMT